MSANLCQWCHAPTSAPQHAGGCNREALKEEIRKLRALEAARFEEFRVYREELLREFEAMQKEGGQ